MEKLLERLDNLIKLGDKKSFEDFSSKEMNVLTLEILKELEQLDEGDRLQVKRITRKGAFDNPNLKWEVVGYVGGKSINLPFKSEAEAKGWVDKRKKGTIKEASLNERERAMYKGNEWKIVKRTKNHFTISRAGKTKDVHKTEIEMIVQEGFVKSCMGKMEGKVDDVGTFCDSLKDRWLKGTAKGGSKGTEWRGGD